MEQKKLWSKEHEGHIRGGYFQKGCKECEKFIGHYLLSGRKFRQQ